MVNIITHPLNLKQEATLAPDIQFSKPLSENITAPKSILLTGATGFLGANLLYELLTQTEADIYCLMRCDDVDKGKKKLEKHLNFYQLWQEKFSPRIVPVLGDLSQPLLGLTQPTFEQLARQIDLIYHNGAWVNSACPYATLKPTNVLGTQEVLRLASLEQTKPVHFVSTLAVFFSPSYSSENTITEAEIPSSNLKGGYKQSKWVAEELIRIAQKRGLPGCIYRPSRILGQSETGIIGNASDFFCSFLKGCIRMGKNPILKGGKTNLVPVDYVSRAIVHLSQQKNAFGRAFHLFNPQPVLWKTVFKELRNSGYTLDPTPADQWLKELEDYGSQNPEDELYSSMLLFATSLLPSQGNKPSFDITQTLQDLEGTEIHCPEVDKELISTYVSYFQQSGYFPPPQPKKKKAASGFWKSIRSNVKRQHQSVAIEAVTREGNLPLSYAQERLWYIDQLHPGDPVHNLRVAYRLKGSLNVAVLEQSLQEIVRRHEILRTCFPEIEGNPVQVINPEISLSLTLVDISKLPLEEKEAEVRRIATEEAQKPFNLAQTPLIRVKLIRLGEKEHVFVRTIHHIINDVWSDTILLRELVTLYSAFLKGEPSPFPPLPIQYGDFAHFQRQSLEGEEFRPQLDYWKQQLAGNIPLLHLPTDRSPGRIPSYQGAVRYIKVSKSLTQTLKGISQKEGVSLFITLLTAFKTLLYQYGRQKDIVICSPVAGRHRLETKKLLGYFSNIMLLRTDFGNNPSFQELMQRVSRVSLGAQENQDMPLGWLVERLGVPGQILSRTMFTMQNAPSQPKKLGNIDISFVDIPEGIANFDLSLSVKETEDSLTCILRYKTDLFEESTIAQMQDQFLSLLEKIATSGDFRLSDLPALGSQTAQPQVQSSPEVEYVPPQTEQEEAIASIWKEVLGLETISIHANFFDIGGRSLGMIQIYHKLRQKFAGDFGVMELFQSPTIAGMANIISS